VTGAYSLKRSRSKNLALPCANKILVRTAGVTPMRFAASGGLYLM